MTSIREDRSTFFKGRGQDIREIANSFLFTPGIQFINLSKLRDILMARQREEMKRRESESEKIGRIADIKKWLWKTLIKVATVICHSH